MAEISNLIFFSGFDFLKIDFLLFKLLIIFSLIFIFEKI